MLVDGRPESIQVLFAFVVAAVVAWLLVPLTERLAYRIGAIDVPNERSLHMTPDAEARRARDPRRRPGLGGPLAPGRRPDGGDPRRRDGDRRGSASSTTSSTCRPRRSSRGRSSPRSSRSRPGSRPAPSRFRSSAGSSPARSTSSTRPLVGEVDVAFILTVIGIVAVVNVINFIDGMDGLAAGVCVISGATLAIIALSLDRPGAGGARGAHRRRRARLPPPRLPAGVELHGRHGLEPARVPARLRRDPGRAEDERGGRALLPARRARDPDHGLELRDRQAAQVPPADLPRRQLALPPPHGGDRVLPAPHPRLPLRLGARPRRDGAGASLRPVLRRPRQLRPRLDRRDHRLRDRRARGERLPRGTSSRSSSCAASACASSATAGVVLPAEEIDRGVVRELETGSFPAVDPDTGELAMDDSRS